LETYCELVKSLGLGEPICLNHGKGFIRPVTSGFSQVVPVTPATGEPFLTPMVKEESIGSKK